MADEAFALSPISARATLPSEEDYDAISQAFMETSRGRWFLGEYARRNRNADTRMVLDAVARIEENLAAQRQPAPDNGLPEALAAIRRAVDKARSAASAGLDGLALEENLAPVRKGARVIREIAWRLREIGADSRICDLIDSQVSAIEGACGQVSSAGPRTALSTAFDLIGERIDEFGESDAAAPQAAGKAMPSPVPLDEMPATAAEEVQSATNAAEAAIGTPAFQIEAAEATDEAADVTAEAAGVIESSEESAEADDEAVLDMIALEMAAPDPSDIEDISDFDDISEIEAAEIHVAELPPADPEITAESPEPVAASAQPATTIQPFLQPTPEPSLGSTLLANGIVRRPNASAADPLAPFRRLSQAEKIALFS